MILQAYIDDSADEDVFVLGGYLATAQQWAAFSDEWKDVLEASRMDRFKMKEISFRYGDNVHEVLDPFIAVAERNTLIEVSCAFRLSDFKHVCRIHGLTGKHANPYFAAWNALVSGTVRTLKENYLSDGAEFIFDEQSEKKDVLDAWEQMLSTAPPDDAAFIKSSPIFRDDMKFLPLQGGDLVGWWARKLFKENGYRWTNAPLFRWRTDRHGDGYIIRAMMNKHDLHKKIRRNLGYLRFPWHLSYGTIDA